MRFRSLAVFFIVAFLAAGALVRAMRPSSPISGIATGSFGSGCGLGSAPILVLGWDSPSGSLIVGFTTITGQIPPPIAQHFLMFGTSILSVPFALPAPFWHDGCQLLIFPDDAIGPLPGDMSLIPIPPNPLLVGATFYLQAIPEYATASPFPSYGITQGVKLTFL